MSLDSVPRNLKMQNAHHKAEHQNTQQQPYDLVCVGFGVSALALATAFADAQTSSRVLFLEQNSSFDWQASHTLPHEQVATSFVHDLITTKNPRSEFTFVNYLQRNRQLALFTNVSQIAPTRLSMGSYLRWVAQKIENMGWVGYGKKAIRITPEGSSGVTSKWVVAYEDCTTGAVSHVGARRIVMATGSTPRTTPELEMPRPEGLIMHASESAGLLERLQPDSDPMNIAIVGENQEAAEIFEHLQTTPGKHRAAMIISDSALRPEERPLYVDDLHTASDSKSPSLPPELVQRMRSQKTHPPHSAQVTEKTIQHLYDLQYRQKVKEPDPSKWRFQTKTTSEISRAEREGSKIRLSIKDTRTGQLQKLQDPFDVVIYAKGYKSTDSNRLLDSIRPLLESHYVSVDAGYRVNFSRNAVAPGCGAWLFGSLEDGNGRRDNFEWLAERGARMMESIKRVEQEGQKGEGASMEVAML